MGSWSELIEGIRVMHITTAAGESLIVCRVHALQTEPSCFCYAGESELRKRNRNLHHPATRAMPGFEALIGGEFCV
jgi:hypothetical protein